MDNEHAFRQQLSQRLSGTHLGLWLLIPFHLQLGTWQILQNWLGTQDPISCRLALQMIHESALCVPRIRAKNTLCHQGFAQLNGLSFLATDTAIHHLCDINIAQTIQMQLALAQRRKALGHYHPGNVWVLDPHRIPSYTQRITVKKKKKSDAPATKMLQNFFCNDAITGQPIAFLIASGGKNCASSTLQLLRLIEKIDFLPALFLADKEHYVVELLTYVAQHPKMNAIVPVIKSARIRKIMEQLTYTEHWPAYATAKTEFCFKGHQQLFYLNAQRTELEQQQIDYKAFIATSEQHCSTTN